MTAKRTVPPPYLWGPAKAPPIPDIKVPAAKVIWAKSLLARGASLEKVAEVTNIPKAVLDRELWRFLGLRLEPR